MLGRWSSLSRGHVVIGGSGCSCGIGGANVRVEEFEQQILDYLRTKYPMAETGSVTSLLREIAAGAARADAAQLVHLLADLNRTFESFEDLHRAR